jgi:hypothetical protein
MILKSPGKVNTALWLPFFAFLEAKNAVLGL